MLKHNITKCKLAIKMWEDIRDKVIPSLTSISVYKFSYCSEHHVDLGSYNCYLCTKFRCDWELSRFQDRPVCPLGDCKSYGSLYQIVCCITLPVDIRQAAAQKIIDVHKALLPEYSKTKYPLGATFIQFPWVKSPNELFKDTEWEMITNNYFGTTVWRRIK